MNAILSSLESFLGKAPLPYTEDEINSVIVDFMLGQLPEQSIRNEKEPLCPISGQSHCVDLFLQIFGEPKVQNLFGDNYLLYYHLKDKKTLVINISALAYENNRVKINGCSVY